MGTIYSYWNLTNGNLEFRDGWLRGSSDLVNVILIFFVEMTRSNLFGRDNDRNCGNFLLGAFQFTAFFGYLPSVI